MKRIFYILLLLLALLLTACGKANTQTPTVTTDPTTAPTTSPTTVPSTAPTTAPDEVSLEKKFEKLFLDELWYRRALGCTFEKPEDIPAWFYFYLGVGAPDYRSFTDDENAFLDNAFETKYGKDEWLMATKLPVVEINKALSILDVTIADIKIPSDWVYYDKTDSYYFWVSDAYGIQGWTITRVEESTDGAVQVYWESSTIWNTQTNEPYPNGTKMVMTMQEKPDGSYLVLSNVPVE